MKKGIDYGVKVNWNLYTTTEKLLCKIPLVNLFCSKKRRVDVTALRKGGGPLYGVFDNLRFPKKNNVYHVTVCLGDKDCQMTVERELVQISDMYDNELAERINAIKPGDDLKWIDHSVKGTK